MPSRYRAAATLLILLLLVAGAAQALTVKNLSYSDTAKNDPHDMIRFSIGDPLTGVSQSNFKPILNISRWDEVWFSILPTNLESGTKTVTYNRTAEKVSLNIGSNTTINFYNISSNAGYEYEIKWLKKPINNVITFTINMNGLTAYYQPPLNATNKSCMSETDCGNEHRPENIVNSYAFYGVKSGDFSAIGGKNYGPGKMACLERIRANDAGINSTWAILNITGTTMTITVDRTWLDKTAIYPVTIDPSLGFTTIGGSIDYYAVSPGGAYLNVNTTTEAGTAQWIAFYGETYPIYPVTEFKGIIFKDSDKSIVATGNANITPDWASPAWKISPFASPPSLVTSTTYDFGIIFNVSTIRYYYDSGGATNSWADNESYPYDTPQSWLAYRTGTLKMSAYIYYTTGGGGTTPSASFTCTAAGVRNSSRTCTNSSASLIPDTTDWYGTLPNQCFSGNLTNVKNPTIYPLNFGWCSMCLIASNGGTLTNTSCNSKASWTMPPWIGG